MHQIFKPALKRAFTSIIERHTDPDKPDNEHNMREYYRCFLSGSITATVLMNALIQDFHVKLSEFDGVHFTIEDYDHVRSLPHEFTQHNRFRSLDTDRYGPDYMSDFYDILHEVYLTFALSSWVQEDSYKWFERAVSYTLEWDEPKKRPHGLTLYILFRNKLDGSVVKIRVTRSHENTTHYRLETSYRQGHVDVATYDKTTFFSLMTALDGALNRAHKTTTA